MNRRGSGARRRTGRHSSVTRRAFASRAAVAIAALLTVLASGCATGAAPVPEDRFTTRWSRAELAAAPSFAADERIVATHYFIWYRYPSEHFYDDAARTDDALEDHFVDPARVDYTSVDWHAGELADMVDAGIDVVLPVYWGVPDNYGKADVSFSVAALPALQAAIARREAAGLPSPRIGLFYDTTTLLPQVRGESRERYDLREPDGKDIFYRTIRDFFDLVDPRYWATIKGRPLVVLYGSGFADGHHQDTIDYVYRGFERDYGVRPYVIRDASWRFRADAVTSWGTALGGPFISGTVAQLGPGYNDAAVPGRTTPIRDREDGDFYRWSWEQVMRSDATIVLVETWNEHHEATGISETVEHGRRYLELTAEYASAWKAGRVVDTGVTLSNPDPIPRPPSAKGREFASAERVSITFEPGAPARGIRLVRGVADGRVVLGETAGEPTAGTVASQISYLYFDVADPFIFDDRSGVLVEYEYLDSGHASHLLQYDSHRRDATLSGAYTDARVVVAGGTGTWNTVRVELPDARFANRQNGGADFRFAVRNGSLIVRRVSVARSSLGR